MPDTVTVSLKPGRDKAVRRRHPWIFSGALHHVSHLPREAGETVEVVSHTGEWIARGAVSPSSQIRVRVWTFDPDEQVDAMFIERRITAALQRRAVPDGEAGRLIHAESDGLPGLIVDRYDQILVTQFLSAAAEYWRDPIVDALMRHHPGCTIFDRSGSEVRAKEALPPTTGLLGGPEPPDLVPIRESERRFLVDVRVGHKTGFYLDQRTNRDYLAATASGTRMLNAFSYTGAFAVAALQRGVASVTNVDTSESALALVERHVALNGFPADRSHRITGNAFHVLRDFEESGERFDLIVLDPPKFVEQRGTLLKGSRGYKDINRLAFRLLSPGGRLLTFSCSGLVTPELFQKIVADAALDAGRTAQIRAFLSQAPDHPVALPFPEAHYLKGLVCDAD